MQRRVKSFGYGITLRPVWSGSGLAITKNELQLVDYLILKLQSLIRMQRLWGSKHSDYTLNECTRDRFRSLVRKGAQKGKPREVINDG